MSFWAEYSYIEEEIKNHGMIDIKVITYKDEEDGCTIEINSVKDGTNLMWVDSDHSRIYIEEALQHLLIENKIKNISFYPETEC